MKQTKHGPWLSIVLLNERWSLPSMQFLTPSPHRANLVKWKRMSLDNCPLCSERQILLHVLNHCQVALNLRWYSIGHDAVLKVITTAFQQHIPGGLCFTADLPRKDNFPEQICPSSDLRPDIMVWSEEEKRMVWLFELFELTVCYEFNTEDAAARKARKYNDLSITWIWGQRIHVTSIQPRLNREAMSFKEPWTYEKFY